MASRKKAPEPVVDVEAALLQPQMTYIATPISTANMTPRTRDEIALRDVIRARLAAVEEAVVEFVREKEAEGLSCDDINELYAVELPLLFGYRVEGSRLRVSYDAQIVERAG
jgi:hypothetical protein